MFLKWKENDKILEHSKGKKNKGIIIDKLRRFFPHFDFYAIFNAWEKKKKHNTTV